MSSKYRKVLLTTIILALVGGSVSAQIFPSVSLTGFDPVSGTYTYTVTCPANSTYQFGYLQIDTQMSNPTPSGDPFSIQGPFVGGVNKLWPTGSFLYDQTNGWYAAFWDPFSRGTVIPANTYWQGTFVLVVPGSEPATGQAATRDGQAGSYHVQPLLVPKLKYTPPPAINPPVTTIALDGTLGQNDWYVSPVTVTISATDADDDLDTTYYKLDDFVVDWQEYLEALIVGANGEHKVAAYSDDTAGNQEDPDEALANPTAFKIDTTAPFRDGGSAEPAERQWLVQRRCRSPVHGAG